MKKKLFSLFMTLVLCVSCVVLLTGCDFLGEGGNGQDGKGDATLYHLTLSTSSNVSLSNEQKEELKAIYGYGEPSAVIKEGVRDQDEIEELKKAGATDEDIAKAGKRQSDGSYSFFDADPLYLTAPKIEGYKLLGFYYKNTEKLAYNPIITDIDGKQALTRWNMEDEDIELEARYQKWTYTISFDTLGEGDVNPNSLTSYCFIDDGVVILEPVTSTNTHKRFVGWSYQDYNDPNGKWIALENNQLPIDYFEEYMRIAAVFEIDKYNISFKLEKYIDSDTIDNNLKFVDVIDEIYVRGNITTVDGNRVVIDSPTDKGIKITEDSEIKMEYGSWLEIHITVKSEYELWRFKINDGEYDIYDGNLNYIMLNSGDITEDSVITLQLVDNID